MRYRVKLSLAFLVIALLSILPTLLVIGIEAKEELWKKNRCKVLTIAVTTAALLDGEGGDLLEQIYAEGRMDSSAYRSMQALLQKIRTANRRDDTYLEYLYTYELDPKNPDIVRVGVDAEEIAGKGAHLGAPYYEATSDGTAAHIHGPYAFPDYVRDPNGLWLSAQAPVLNSKGVQVGAVGADISAKDIETQFMNLLLFGIWSGGSALILALLFGVLLARGMTSSLELLSYGVSRIKRGDFTTRINLPTHDEFHDLSLAMNEMTKGLQERTRLKESFARYVSSHVMEKIVKEKRPIHLEGERRKITVLFSDIRHFASLAEVMPAEEVVSLLNTFFDRMLEVIFHHHGTFDKFLGDGLMVEFGAPLEDERQADHALETAIAMQRALAILNGEWKSLGKPRLEIGIGIHTGEAVVGNIGTEMRMEYTAIGDSVNIASRLQDLAVEKGVPILVSQATNEECSKGRFHITPLGKTSLMGRAHEIEIFGVQV